MKSRWNVPVYLHLEFGVEQKEEQEAGEPTPEPPQEDPPENMN